MPLRTSGFLVISVKLENKWWPAANEGIKLYYSIIIQRLIRPVPFSLMGQSKLTYYWPIKLIWQVLAESKSNILFNLVLVSSNFPGKYLAVSDSGMLHSNILTSVVTWLGNWPRSTLEKPQEPPGVTLKGILEMTWKWKNWKPAQSIVSQSKSFFFVKAPFFK